MNAVSSLAPGAAVSAFVRPAAPAPRPSTAGAAESIARGPAVVFGGSLGSVAAVAGPDAIDGRTGVMPVPPVKPVAYRPGAAVNVSI